MSMSWQRDPRPEQYRPMRTISARRDRRLDEWARRAQAAFWLVVYSVGWGACLFWMLNGFTFR